MQTSIHLFSISAGLNLVHLDHESVLSHVQTLKHVKELQGSPHTNLLLSWK